MIKLSQRAGWSCLRIEQLVERVFHEKLLKNIAELTGCTLSYDSESRKIIIIGPLQEDCDRCIQKLDRIRDYDVSYPAYVGMYHTNIIGSPVCGPIYEQRSLSLGRRE